MVKERGLLIKVDRMRPEDLDEVMAIEVESFSLPWTEEMFLSELRAGEHAENLVARAVVEEGTKPQIVGYICLWVLEDELHINNIAVHPQFRQQGIAQRLLSYALELGRKRGVKSAVLEVRASNRAAQALYEKFGFKVVGVRRRYYTHPTEDALIMRKDDLNGRETP